MSSSTVIGIDLGTTNSLVAYIENGKPVIIPNALGSLITPSVVGLSDAGTILVGEGARERLTTHPHLTASSFKRFMGTEKTVSLGRKKYRAEELSALILSSLKDDASSYLGYEVNDVVISVPAYFNDAQRKATRAAAEIAGLNLQRLINEPTAAAIAYGLHESVNDSTFMVFDLGGGTFDISILEMFEDVMQVHACAGDNHLGGEDFTKLLLQKFLDHCGLKFNSFDEQDKSTLLRAAENTKFALSKNSSSVIEFRFRGKLYRHEFTEVEFENLVEPLLARLREPMVRALRDAELKASDLDSIVMVGGACRMPIIRRVVSKLLLKLPHGSIDYDHTIAMGAAVQGGLIAEDASLNEVVLTDVMPFSLGVGIHHPNTRSEDDLLFSPIIERNSPVPISRMGMYHPVDEKQKKVEFKIFQGESRYTTENLELGKISVSVKPGPIHSNLIDVRFTFDMNGILEVEVQRENETKRLIVEGNPGVLSKKEIEASFKKLSKLKIHPRDTLENVTILNKASRIYEQTIGEERDYVGSLIQSFEEAIASQNLDLIDAQRKEFEQILSQLDDDPLSS